MEQLRRTKMHFVHCFLPQHGAGLCDVKINGNSGDRSNGSSPKTSVSSQEGDILMNVPLVRSQVQKIKLFQADKETSRDMQFRFSASGCPDSRRCSASQERLPREHRVLGVLAQVPPPRRRRRDGRSNESDLEADPGARRDPRRRREAPRGARDRPLGREDGQHAGKRQVKRKDVNEISFEMLGH